MKFRSALMAGGMLVAATSAFAADLAPRSTEPLPPSVPVLSWTGFYVGAQAGYGWGDSKIKLFGTPFGNYAKSNAKPANFFGGVYAGYNYRIYDSFVIGAEADVNITDGSYSDNKRWVYTATGAPLVSGIGSKQAQTWSGSARLRAGYAIDRFLPYVTAGVAFEGDDIKATTFGQDTGKNSFNRTGWTAGAGLEYAFTDHIVGRIEYRYSDYGKKYVYTAPYFKTTVPYKTSDVRVGVSYNF